MVLRKILLLCLLALCALSSHAQVSQGSQATVIIDPGTPEYLDTGILIPAPGGPSSKPMNGNGTLGPVYSQSKCGLNYATASQKIGQRLSPAGVAQPAAFVIGGIPAGSVIEKAFLWTGGSGDGSAQTATLNGPAGSYNYPMSVVGSGPDVCWGFAGTYSYRADVTPAINGNGTYNISGLLTNGPGTTTNDMNGATLMVIYSNTSASWAGNINISDGAIMVAGGTANYTQPLTAVCGTPTNGRAFSIVDDLQQGGFTQTLNGTAAGGTWNWWNYFDTGTTYTTGQTSSSLVFVDASDCYAVMGYGTYYQNTSCLSCTSFTVNASATPAGCTVCNGTATASVTPAGSYTYTWLPSGGNSATASGLCAGNYTVSVTSAGITKTQTVTVGSTLSPTLSIAQTSIACNGNCTGSSTVTATGGTGAYGYTWTPSGGSSAAAASLCTGNYTVTVRDANGCSKTASTTINQPSAVTATTSQTNVACKSQSNGAASVSASGGTGSFTYTWTPSGGSAATASGLTAGNYTCTIKDGNSCSIIKTFTITEPALLTAAPSQTNILCYGGTGTASVSVSGGAGSYTYSWTPAAGSSSSLGSLTQGTYSCVIKDANNCSLTQTFSLTQPASLTIITSQTNVACNSGSTGAAAVSVTGGTGAYTYTWAPSGGNSATASGLPAGTYTCTLKDANLCSKTATVIITQPAALTGVSSQTNVLCNGAATGAASYSVSGGTPGYTYSWTPVSSSTNSVSGLGSGTYTFTAKDAGNCAYSGTVNITQPSPVTVVSTQTNVSCNGQTNGSANVAVSGGTGPYTYTWSPSGGNAATASSLAAGQYTCAIRDANNCSASKTFTITEPAILVAAGSQTNILCNGGTGTASVSVSGGTAAYTYSWSPAAGSGPSLSGLTAGTYSCLVKDAGNCSLTRTFVITQPAALSSSSVQANVLCYGASTGSAGFSVAGGTPGYTYSWTPSGAATPSVTGLAAGNYTFTAKDLNNCTLTQTLNITQPSSVTVVATQTNVLCNGNATGQAAVSVSGGTPSYSYSWSPTGVTTYSAGALTAGTYSCLVTDGNGCALTKTVNITQPAALAAAQSQTNVACNGGNNGQAVVTISGGAGPYTYTWSPVSSNTYSVGGLSSGSYTCIATDANGCQVSSAFTIAQQSSLIAVASHTDVTCHGFSNGSADLAVTGGAPGYTYSWLPSGGNAALASSLPAGTYTCTITDANNCSDTKTVSIIEPTALSASSSQTNVSCYGLSNGAAAVTVLGGTPSYSYSWAPSSATTASLSGLSAGNYTLTATDANSCVLAYTLAITQPSSLTATSSQTNVSCNGAANGSAAVSIGGGTAAYGYTWSPSGGNAASASPLAPGNYTCNVSDAKGCSISQSFTITEPAPLVISLSHTNVTCYGGSTGAATAGVTGGTGAYTYTWLPSGGNGVTASSLVAGNYTCTVADANNCTRSATVAILQPTAPLSVVSTQTNISCHGGSNGAGTVSVSGGTPSYSYTWSPSGGNAATSPGLSAGTYTVLITDANNCSLSQTLTLMEPAALATTATQTNVLCNGAHTGQAAVSVSGGTASYSYSWSPAGATTYSAGALAAGTYSCLVTDGNLCMVTQTVSITQPAALAAILSQTNVTCNGGTNGQAAVSLSGGVGPYTYTWTPVSSNAYSAGGLSSGTYTCLATDANGCQLSSIFSITQQSSLAATISATNVSCYNGSNGSSAVAVTGGAPGYTYTWSPSGGNAALASSLTAGSYTCLIADANNCALTKTISITQPTALSASFTQTNVSCYGLSNGAAALTVSGGTPSYSYSWTPAAGTASVASGLAAGSYTYLVTDLNGCTTGNSVSITQPSQLMVSNSFTNVTCNGAANGSAIITASGGTPGYSYSWTPSVSTSSMAASLSPAAYSCVAGDTKGCTATTSFTITQPAALAGTMSSTPADCGASNGSASIVVSGGTAPYTYTWSPSGGNASTAANIATGTYSCLVTDNQLCTKTLTVNVAVINPTISATASQTSICPAKTATFTASGGSTYTWSPSASLSAPNGTVTSASPASTTVYTLTGANAYGCSSTATVQLTVHAAPVITASASQATICAQSSTSLSASGASTYTWSPAQGLSGTSGNTTVATLTTSSDYTVNATDANGCAGSQVLQIAVNPLPVISVSPASASVCTGSLTILTASGANTYAWSNGGTSAATTVSSPANSVYTVTGTDANGCKSFTTAAVSVNPLPVLSVTGVTTICQGQSTSLSVGGATSYTWSTGQNGNSITPSPAGTTAYSVTGEDNNGCQSTAGITVNVLVTPTLSIAGDNEICLGDNTTLTASGGSSYQWSNGEQTSQVTLSPGAVAVYTVTSGISPCMSSATFTVTVDIPVPVLATPASTLINYGQSTTLAASSSAGIYNWQPSTGLSCNTCPNPVASPVKTTEYIVTTTDDNGCRSTDTVIVEVDLTCGEVFVPEAFSPNGDNNNDTWCVYGNCIQDIYVELYDRWGQKVFEGDSKASCWDGRIMGEMQNSNVYMFQVRAVLINGEKVFKKGNVTLVR